jgi:hypothetical protein
MTDHTISPDGKFMWTGSEWIPAPPPTAEKPSSASVLLNDSVVAGNIQISQLGSSLDDKFTGTDSRWSPTTSESTKQSAIVSLKDSVVGGDVNIHQHIDPKLIQHIYFEIARMNINVDELRVKINSKKMKPALSDKEYERQISDLTNMVMAEETKQGKRILNTETYEELSTIAIASNSKGATYFTKAFAETSTNSDEWFEAAKRQAKRAYFIINLHLYRTPEAFQILLDIDKKIIEYDDKRIMNNLWYIYAIRNTRGMASKLNIWACKILSRKKKKDAYDRQAALDSSLPLWSELPQLINKSKESKLMLRQYLKARNRVSA